MLELLASAKGDVGAGIYITEGVSWERQFHYLEEKEIEGTGMVPFSKFGLSKRIGVCRVAWRKESDLRDGHLGKISALSH